jgi:dTDP-4-amino-4,6-dideoxygalactose transaminase
VTNTKGISFLDLVTPHKELQEELCKIFRECVSTAGFIGGPMVQSFEQDFAAYCETQHCVGVNSGTDALRFALIAAGVTNDDIVVTVPNTFIATTEAISQAGARPTFVDIDEATYNMDTAKLRSYLEEQCNLDPATGTLVEKVTKKRVAAIVPVHLYGQMADMDPILELAEKCNLVVVEDACQAHGAQYFSKAQNRWCKAGSMGRAAAFSFYPGKNLGACGEAGAITTNDAEIAAKSRMLRDHGQAQKYYHDIEGFNGRLDSIQAGILGVKLKHLTKWNEIRREIASRYKDLLASHRSCILPHESEGSRGVYHLYVIRVVTGRDALIKHFAQAGIGTGIHYPIPLHLQKAYMTLGYKKGDFPVSEKVAPQIISLPMYPQLGREEQEKVAKVADSFLRPMLSSEQLTPQLAL